MDALVVALVGLGGLYFISEDKKCKEGFSDPGPPQAYPVGNPVVENDDEDYIQKYDTPNQTTDKLFPNHTNEISTSEPSSSPTDLKTFKHNNMVPFFGGKITGVNIDYNSQSKLDTYTGSGSQHNSKKEHVPMFQPAENVQLTHGAPHSNDFFQSRQTLGNAHNNTKPWQEEQVGPGLGKGYSAAGTGGFNSGMEERSDWLPKTVDQLRVDTNPRMDGILNGLEGPAISKIYKTGIVGKIETTKPDAPVLGADRFFTGTGASIAPVVHSTQMMGHVHRPETTVEHYGAGSSGNTQKHKAPEKYSDLANKPHNYTDYIGNAYIHNAQSATSNDNNVGSFSAAPNNRATTKNTTDFGIVGSVIGSVIAPVLDIMRPSRKENVLGNLRESGNVQQRVGGHYVINPGDRPKTTIKEMTTGRGNHINVQATNHQSGAYKITEHQQIINNRATTNTSECGNPNASNQGHKQIESYIQQRNNNNRIQTNHTPSANHNIFNGNINAELCTNRGVRNSRGMAPTVFSSTPSVNTLGNMNTANYKTSQGPSDRIESTMLDAFKQNPYTHSLQTY